MKKLFTFAAVALATISANAQEKSWTFENWTTAASVTSNVTVDGLTLHATSSAAAAVEDKKKSAEINGEKVNYTKCINLKGTGSTSGRHISFPVEGPCEITVVCYHGSSSVTYKRCVNVSYGAAYDAASLHSIVVPTGGAASASTVRYELDKPNTIYLGSGNSGVGICGIYVKPITPAEPQPATQSKAWDFTAELSANDIANLDADAANWTKTEGDYLRYSYSPAFTADEAIDNLYGIMLTANGKEVEKTQGLRFGRYNGKLDKDRFRLDNGKRLNINGQYVGFIIPDLKRNDVVKVRFSTATDGDSRDIVLTNATTEDNCVSSSTETPNEITCKVLSDGYVGFRAGTNGLNYYAVSVNADLPITDGISEIKVTDKTTDGKIYNLSGMEVKNPTAGIYIKDGRKFVVKK